jgi:hypothetical protein
MIRQNKTGKGSNEKSHTIQKIKWYGYYTDKTIPGIITETNKQYSSQVHDFFIDHDLWNKTIKQQNVFYIENERKGKLKNILQYHCAICGFTYGLASLHAIRLHCMKEHREEDLT